MKIRTMLVSNSSSSSFAIIGIESDEAAKGICEKLGIDDDWFDREYSNGMAMYGDIEIHGIDYVEEYETVRGRKVTFEIPVPYYLGFSAAELLQEMTIPQAIKHVEDELEKRYGINVKDKVGFHYGECGEG